MAAQLVAIVSQTARAENDPPVDKSSYSLLNPVPDDKLRDFDTDRPGKSHTPITIDVGHVQIESDIVNYTNNPHGPGNVRTTSITFGAPLTKLGVTNNLDVELGQAIFTKLHQTTFDPGSTASTVTRARGYGDTLLGLKYNVFGNDGGDVAFALLPFVKLPTAARGLGNNHVEFTINAPYQMALPAKFSLVIEPTAGVLRNVNNDRYAPNVGLIVNLSHDVLVEGLTAAAEVAVNTSLDNVTNIGLTQVSFDPSLQYKITKNLQLDVGIYLGLNRATPRYNPYTGISYRF